MTKYLGEYEVKLQKSSFPTGPIQNVSAAMENLLLATSNLRYGTCWMIGLLFAMEEIEKIINLNKEGYEIVAMTPLGIPAEDVKVIQPKRKSLDEIVTYL